MTATSEEQELMEAYAQRRFKAKVEGVKCKYSALLSDFQNPQESEAAREQQSDNDMQIEATDELGSNKLEMVVETSYAQTSVEAKGKGVDYNCSTVLCEFQKADEEPEPKALHEIHPSGTTGTTLETTTTTTITTLAITTTTTTTSSSSSSRSKQDVYFGDLPIPEPAMPDFIRYAITTLGGTSRPLWVGEKELTNSDVSDHEMRLFIPWSEALINFMTKTEFETHEVRVGDKEKHDRVLPMIDPAGDATEIDFRIWPSLKKMVFTSKLWKEVIKNFGFEPKLDTVQIWSFRSKDSKLCFAVNRTRKA